jgi:hypothetical protein
MDDARTALRWSERRGSVGEARGAVGTVQWRCGGGPCVPAFAALAPLYPASVASVVSLDSTFATTRYS